MDSGAQAVGGKLQEGAVRKLEGTVTALWLGGPNNNNYYTTLAAVVQHQMYLFEGTLMITHPHTRKTGLQACEGWPRRRTTPTPFPSSDRIFTSYLINCAVCVCLHLCV